tara:strand:- start:197 stop:412 length:216 start_codon:yes stop_codon:yes gene_type:complete
MSTKIGMMFTSGYTSSTSPTSSTSQSSNTTQIISTKKSMTQDNYELKRIALCMDLYGLMKAKPCGSCGGFG